MPGKTRAGEATRVASLNVDAPGRLPAPRGLTPAAKGVWRATVNELPPGWLQAEQMPLLDRFCTHVARARQLERRIAGLDPTTDYELYRRLARLSATETSMILPLARSLRLTVQARTRPDSAVIAQAGTDSVIDIEAAAARVITNVRQWRKP